MTSSFNVGFCNVLTGNKRGYNKNKCPDVRVLQRIHTTRSCCVLQRSLSLTNKGVLVVERRRRDNFMENISK